ncbi:Brefeldin A-inhibited guanine nucleotide-exchange protein 1 [Borealophlyctis nickersoniae]|nr:Brefeldin A-inhibited guanine nucleotide-exchange protein 1 [Borealophlyctis nickersoniae]
MLKQCLERLAVEGSRSKDLKDAIAEALTALDAEREEATANGQDPESLSADNYWTPFRLACHPSNPVKLREAALDGLQKLIAHKLLRGAVRLDSIPPPFPSGTTASRRGSATGADNDFSNLDTSSPLAPATADSQDGSVQYPSNPFLIDEIVHTVCTSFSSNASDEPVHLQVLKVLLTAVTSTACEVHEVSLLKIIQTCFNIHQHSRSQTNKMTAKASLTQMVNLVFSRMERYAEVLARSLETGSMAEIERLTGPEARAVAANADGDGAGEPAHAERDTSSPRATTAANSDTNISAENVQDAHRVSEASVGSSAVGNLPGSPGVEAVIQEPADSADGQVTVETTVTNGTEATEKGTEPVASESQTNGGPSATLSSPPPVVVTSADEGEDPAGTMESPSAETNGEASEADATRAESLTLRRVQSVYDEQSGITPPPELASPSPSAPASPRHGHRFGISSSGTDAYDPTVSYYNELLRKDAFLVFRLLCRLSIQTDGQSRHDTTFSAASVSAAAASPMDEISQQCTRTRVLSLELLLSILNNSGPTLQTDDLYITLIKQNLTLAISRNGITTNPMLFELSLSIFLMVIRFWRARLKTEIEILLNTIYLHILEMGNSTYKQKSMVLQGLLKICENPQTLVDLYLNYDCDLNAVSVFERIISACGRVAQGRSDAAQQPASSGMLSYAVSAAGLDSKEQLVRAQERRLKLRGLCCLVAVVNSLVEWSAEVAPGVGSGGRGRKGQGTGAGRRASVSGAEGGGKAGLRKSLEKGRVGSQSVELTAKSFLDALAPTNQANPVLVNKHPLHSVSLERNSPYNFPNGSTGSLQSTNTAVGEDDTTQIESLASRKQLLRQAVKQFNLKPSKGIKMLVEHEFVQNDPNSIADFLRSTSGLTKAAIGEYLGEGDAFNVQVMHAFIDSMEFAGAGFVSALRSFLQTFRLPGEAQKIDRIMEKFADRYCENNPDVFARADTAYTLAFSVIMLNTDQHSAQIKHRMDKAAFLKNNRGINDNADLPDEYLGAIFDEIHSDEIVMEEEHAGQLAQMAMGWGAGDLNDRQRMELYRKEIGAVQKKSQMLMAGGKQSASVFRSAGSPELARPMFGMASWPLMAVFSLLFEGAADDEDESAETAGDGVRPLAEPKVADLCLKGFAGSIQIASIFRMETERDAFVSSLAKLTGLSHVQDIRPKNIKAIKALIGIANSLGEYLEGSWMQVLKAVSLMERLQLIANRGSGEGRRSGDVRAERISMEEHRERQSGTIPPLQRGVSVTSFKSVEELAAQARLNPTLEKLVVEFQSQATVVAIDRMFTNTVNLSATALIHFFRCLCHVSMEEVGLDPATKPGTLPTTIGGITTPRMYLLQKIVEIAHYNIHRIRFEWTQVWRILRPHFDAVGLHPSLTVSTFAVDSLRQLSMKFLEREELGHYASQSEFLKSFEWIIRFTTRWEIKELILQSMSQMVAARARCIRSGWKSIFGVLVRGAMPNQEKQGGQQQLQQQLQGESEEQDRLIRASFAVVQSVFGDHFEAVLAAGAFVDYVACLAEFALLDGVGRTRDEVVIGSVQLLQFCAKFLVQVGEDEAEVLLVRRASVADISAPGGGKGVGGSEAMLATPSVGTPSMSKSATPYLLPNGVVSEEHFYLKWFPILSAFSRVAIGSESGPVRTRAIDALFDTLRDAGHLFDAKYWMKVFGSVVCPIFEDLRDPMEAKRADAGGGGGSGGGGEDGSAVWIHGLRLLVDLSTAFFDRLIANGGEVIKGVLDLMIGMLERKDEKLATTGGICLHQFLVSNVGKFGKVGCWELVTTALERAFKASTPAELLNCDYGAVATPLSARSPTGASGVMTPGTQSSVVPLAEVVDAGIKVARAAGPMVTLDTLDFEHTIVKCVTHLELVQSTRDVALTRLTGGRRGSEVKVVTNGQADEKEGAAVVNGVDGEGAEEGTQRAGRSLSLSTPAPQVVQAVNSIPPTHRARWLRCLYSSYSVARAFNADTDLRYAIYRRGLVPQMPHLVKQETVGIATYLRVLFAVYRAQGDSDESMQPGTAGRGDSDDNIPTALAKETRDVFERYVDFLQDQQKNVKDVGLWSPVVVVIFRELIAMDGWWSSSSVASTTTTTSSEATKCLKLKYHLPRYFRLGVRMMSCDRAEVRAALQEFMEKVGEEFLKVA